jgi:WD40 repeat protein
MNPIITHSKLPSEITVCLFDPTEKYVLLAVRDDPAVWLIDAFTGRLQNKLNGHHGVITALCFSRTGDAIAAATNEGCFVWDEATGKLVTVLKAGPIHSCCFVPKLTDGKTKILMGYNQFLRVWG